MMKKTYSYNYPRPALGTDVLLFSKEEHATYILLIERGNDPFKGYWAFPGGFVEEGESAEQAAIRELEEETNIRLTFLHQLATFSKPDRDPRGWVVTVAFYAFVYQHDIVPKAGDDAARLQWFPLSNLPKLAFDHREILDKALDLLPINES
jgi:8-oxo-dGTP diphosphatase